MPYATAQDLIESLGEREATQISDRARTGMPDAGVLDQALADASGEMDAYIGRRYALPLTYSSGSPGTPGQLLKRCAVDIARYRLTGTEVMETEAIRSRFKDAIRVMEQIAKGELSLGDVVLLGAGSAASVSGASAVRTGDKQFGDLSGVL
jgi:phage gp36-like protein